MARKNINFIFTEDAALAFISENAALKSSIRGDILRAVNTNTKKRHEFDDLILSSAIPNALGFDILTLHIVKKNKKLILIQGWDIRKEQVFLKDSRFGVLVRGKSN